jgi:hypothetical protein
MHSYSSLIPREKMNESIGKIHAEISRQPDTSTISKYEFELIAEVVAAAIINTCEIFSLLCVVSMSDMQITQNGMWSALQKRSKPQRLLLAVLQNLTRTFQNISP